MARRGSQVQYKLTIERSYGPPPTKWSKQNKNMVISFHRKPLENTYMQQFACKRTPIIRYTPVEEFIQQLQTKHYPYYLHTIAIRLQISIFKTIGIPPIKTKLIEIGDSKTCKAARQWKICFPLPSSLTGLRVRRTIKVWYAKLVNIRNRTLICMVRVCFLHENNGKRNMSIKQCRNMHYTKSEICPNYFLM